ncbi:MAG: protein disulfide oxidoreductase [Gammaproteobacteria bacterium]|nr:protein disulfide oxidoreductase [Gammaproteobacteria bacterium]
MPSKRSKTLRSWLVNILIFALIYWAIQAYQSRGAPSSGLAPQIEGVTVNGQNLSLASLKGEPVLVYFWATWCGICSLTRDSINNISQDHAVITIASQSGSTAEIFKYIKEHNFSASVINDEQGALSQLYGVRAFPSIFIIDAQGEISDVEIGLSSEWGLRLRLWWAGI